MTKKLRSILIFLIFLNGYVSLSLELLVLRQLSFWVGSSAVITSIIMGTFLGFMSLGYFLGSSERVTQKSTRRILSYSFFIISLLSVFATSFPLVATYFSMLYLGGVTSSVIQTFLYSFVFLSVGPFLFGFNTTILSRCLHRYSTNYTGHIMAWDTIGSVLGSLATTLFLMPFVGVNYTVVFITVLSVFGALILRPRLWVWVGCLVTLIASFYINSTSYQLRTFGILVNNANSTIFVSEYSDGTRVLNMNNLSMSIFNPHTGNMAEYINYINSNFIDTLPQDRVHKILILGAGGFTVGLNDTFNDYTFVDIEPTLRDVSEKYFLGNKLTSNKKFIVQDASQYLKNTSEQYDMILLDVYSNAYQIPEGLITSEFMHRIKRCVAPNGVVLINAIVNASFGDNFSRVFDNTFRSVFENNVNRQIIGPFNAWADDDTVNVVYSYHNYTNDNRIYTINKTPVIYDR